MKMHGTRGKAGQHMTERIVIVGLGEIGRRLAAAAGQLGDDVTRVARADGGGALPGDVGTALVVCVRETDLSSVLARVPPERAGDLVVVQNGFIDDVLAPFGAHTRAVLWFTAKGTFFADLLPSPVRGPRAALASELIRAAGATAETIEDPAVFKRMALEKAIWCCVAGAPLAVWDCDLATAMHTRIGDVEAIVDEACRVVTRACGADLSSQRVLATLMDTCGRVGWMRGSTSALAWRNGQVVRWGTRYGLATPANQAIVDGNPGPQGSRAAHDT